MVELVSDPPLISPRQPATVQGRMYEHRKAPTDRDSSTLFGSLVRKGNLCVSIQASWPVSGYPMTT